MIGHGSDNKDTKEMKIKTKRYMVVPRNNHNHSIDWQGHFLSCRGQLESRKSGQKRKEAKSTVSAIWPQTKTFNGASFLPFSLSMGLDQESFENTDTLQYQSISMWWFLKIFYFLSIFRLFTKFTWHHKMFKSLNKFSRLGHNFAKT